MQLRFLSILSVSLFLFACSTSVVTDEERELPEDAAPFGSEMKMEKEDEVMEEESMEEEAIEEDEVMEEEVEVEEEEAEDSEEEVGEEEADEENDEGEEEAKEDVVTTIQGDVSQSLISFIGKKGSAVSHEGKFSDFVFRLELDPNEPTDLSLADMYLSIQISSMSTDSDGLTSHLLADDFFASGTYPTAEFSSTGITAAGGNTYTVAGMLSMKGTEQPLSFDAEITDSYLSMSTVIDRTDFGVGGPAGGVKSIDAAVPVTAKIIFK